MAVMASSPYIADASRWNHPSFFITVRYLPFGDKVIAIRIIAIMQSTSHQQRTRLALTLCRGSQGAGCSRALIQSRPHHRRGADGFELTASHYEPPFVS